MSLESSLNAAVAEGASVLKRERQRNDDDTGGGGAAASAPAWVAAVVVRKHLSLTQHLRYLYKVNFWIIINVINNLVILMCWPVSSSIFVVHNAA